MTTSLFTTGTPVSLLFADPDPGVRFAFSDYFRGHGFAIECAVSAPDAEAWLFSRGFTALLIDLHLGGDREGLELARRARRMHPGMVICLLATPQNADFVMQAERVADAVILRPRPLADVAQLILALTAPPVRLGNCPPPQASVCGNPCPGEI